MKTTVTAASGIALGVALGAGGWLLWGPDSGSEHAPRTADYASAQAIADKLDKAGLTVSMIHKNTDATYVTDVGGTAWDFTVNDVAGTPPPGDSGINMFPNADALKSWASISKGLGGIAVVGDTWAVSLPSNPGTRTASLNLAQKVADALGGTVQK